MTEKTLTQFPLWQVSSKGNNGLLLSCQKFKSIQGNIRSKAETYTRNEILWFGAEAIKTLGAF